MSTALPETGGGAATATTGPQRHLGLALLVIATAQLMVVLDATIVNVALTHIQHALGFSGTGLEWVVNAYALTFGGVPARRVRHYPGVAAGRPGAAGHRRSHRRTRCAVPGHHDLPRGPAT